MVTRGTPPDPAPSLRDAQDAVRGALAPLPQPAGITRSVSHLLDDLLPVPGTGVRFGLDPLLSVLPWAGSSVSAAIGGIVLVDAVRLRAPVPVLARMVTNSILDWLLGLIPFVGPVVDVAFRSNRMNLRLLDRTIADRELVHRASVRYWIAAAGLLAGLLAVIAAIPIVIVLGLGNLLTGAG